MDMPTAITGGASGIEKRDDVGRDRFTWGSNMVLGCPIWGSEVVEVALVPEGAAVISPRSLAAFQQLNF